MKYLFFFVMYFIAGLFAFLIDLKFEELGIKYRVYLFLGWLSWIFALVILFHF